MARSQPCPLIAFKDGMRKSCQVARAMRLMPHTTAPQTHGALRLRARSRQRRYARRCREPDSMHKR